MLQIFRRRLEIAACWDWKTANILSRNGMCAIERRAFNLNVHWKREKLLVEGSEFIEADEHVHGEEGNLHYTRIIELKAIDILIYAVNEIVSAENERLPRDSTGGNWISLSYHLWNRFLMCFITFPCEIHLSRAPQELSDAAVYESSTW